jgi:4-diphosphocytidyl-2-C-methyl-D-erythritol kinase
MNTVKLKSYAKVNLTLEIVGVENGYHLLDSLVCSIDVFDTIFLKKRKDALSSVTMHGLGSESIPPEKNNALKAAEAFSAMFQTNGADITVYKYIPIGAGLGGSSADISGVLNGMAKLYGVEDRAALKELADELGSDTGYMLTGGFARMQGRGEKITPIKTKQQLHMLLICPTSSVSAGGCYRAFDEQSAVIEKQPIYTEQAITALMQNNVNDVGRYLMNDLFIPAASLNTDVKIAYEEMQSFSPLGVVMTGSGSCVIGLFETKELCQWAQSRYKGKFKTIVAKSVFPDAEGKKIWKNPFKLYDEEL